MKTRWTTTKLITTGGLAVLRLVLSMGGGGIIALTGIPGSGLVNGLVSAAIFSFTCLLLRNFGAATIQAVIFSTLAIPLPNSGGAGFVPKILIGLISGLVVDSLFALLRRREKIAATVAGGMGATFVPLGILGIGWLFAMPGLDRSIDLFLSPVLAGILAGGLLAGWFGWFVYDKLKDSAVVVRIQGDTSA